ncbi:MAG: DUF6325 family protein [Microthrixaceae bacterium]
MTDNDSSDDLLGPVDILVIAFPDGSPHPEGFASLAALVESSTVRVLDMEFVSRDANGAHIVDPADLPAVDGFDVDYWSGASAQLLDSDDLEYLTADLQAGELAVVVLIEQQWILGLVGTWTSTGARLVADGGVPTEDLIDALDAAEQN